MSFNIATVNDAIAEAIPDREALIFRDRRLTFRDVSIRSNRLANYLLSQGLRKPTPRAQLADWESGQDHIALYMYNCNEYLESTLGCLKARTLPFNVNFRYVADELLYLLQNATTRGIIFHARFAPQIDALRKKYPALTTLIQVADESGNALISGAVDYDTILATSSPERPPSEPAADDLFMIYTGGTTGMPKGVLWKQGDVLDCALGGRDNDGTKLTSLEAYKERAKASPGFRYLTAPPFMHGTGQWVALGAWHRGNTVHIQDNIEHLKPDEILAQIQREKINLIALVGDAFGRPLVSAIEKREHDVSSLTHVVNSGAALSAPVKARLIELVPRLRIVDTIGASETGPQGIHVSSAKGAATTGKFSMSGANVVLSEDMTRVLAPGEVQTGWFASRGEMPVGYLGDAEKTKRTFRVIDGVRYSVPGDRVRLQTDGGIEFIGRDSFMINSGGEKIFVEEVEQALLAHAAVADTLVSWRPSERWGQEVVAVVQLKSGADATEQSLLAEAEKHIARYKLPKAFVFVDRVQRAPNGKADYVWAKSMAQGTQSAVA